MQSSGARGALPTGFAPVSPDQHRLGGPASRGALRSSLVEAQVGLAMAGGPIGHEHAAWLRSTVSPLRYQQLETPPPKQRHMLHSDQQHACPACGHCCAESNTARSRTFTTPRVLETPGRSSADLRRSLSSVRSAPLDLSPLAKQLKTATQEDIRDRIQQLTLTRDLLVRPGASEEDTRDARILEIKIAASEAMLTDLSLDRVESTYAPRREVTELWPQRAPEHAVAGVAPKLVESNGGPLLQRRFISGPSTASSASDAITANEAPYDEDQREDGCDEDSDDFVTIPVGPVLNAAVIEPHSTHSVPLVATLFEGFGTLHEHEGTQYGRRVKAVPLHALISANEDESCSMSISGLPDMEDVLSGRFGTRMSAPTLNSPPGEDAPSARVTRTPIMPRTVARKSPRPIHINISTRPGRQEPEITLSTPRQVSPQPGAYLWDRILTWG